MKGSNNSGVDGIIRSNGGYVNHGLNGSRGSLNMENSDGTREPNREIQGSSDFICKSFIHSYTIKIKVYDLRSYTNLDIDYN